VSIKMAKEQNLSLNPTKISGVCGRLMCCLKYEEDHYEATRKRMPRIGKEVITPDGNGTVVDLKILKETVRVRIPKGDSTEQKDYPLEDVKRVSRFGENSNTGRTEENDDENDDLTEDIVEEAAREENISEEEAKKEFSQLTDKQ